MKPNHKYKSNAPAKGAGRSVSTFRYPEDDALILHLVGEMAAKGIKVNDSQIIRAGLMSLKKLKPSELIGFLNQATENDNRRGVIPLKERATRRISDKKRSMILERDGKCQECGKTEGLVVDHILAIANGGDNAESNLQALCGQCNQKKGAKLIS